MGVDTPEQDEHIAVSDSGFDATSDRVTRAQAPFVKLDIDAALGESTRDEPRCVLVGRVVADERFQIVSYS